MQGSSDRATAKSSRIARVFSWLASSAALAGVGALAGGVAEALGASGLAEVIGTVGYSAILAWPALFVLVMIVRLLWRGWRPAQLRAQLVDEHGSAPRLAGWIVFVGLAALVLAWGTFNTIRLLAAWTMFRATFVAIVVPPMVVLIALAIGAASRPAIELFTAAFARLDRACRRKWNRSVVTPVPVGIATAVAIAGVGYLSWRVSVAPRIGYIDLSILRHPVVAIAATIVAAAVRTRLGRRPARIAAIACAALTAAAIGFALWLRAARPVDVLQLWARPTIASEAVEKLYYLEDLRSDIELLVKPPPLRPGAQPRDVVLITIDATRADHTPLNGGHAEMPRLARLGTSGAVFASAFSPGNVTRRSITSIATGVSPTRVRGKVAGWALRLDPRHILLAERFRAAGYDTAGFFCCPSFWSSIHRLGINRGVDYIYIENDGKLLAQAAAQWLAQRRAMNPTKPLYVWIHFIEPHNWTQNAPIMNSPADRRAQYDHVLGEVDADLGIVLDAFAAAGDRAPIIAVTADHGEALGDHGQPYHSTDLYDSQIHVPLVIAGPGIAPHRVEQPVGLVGLAPTLLDLAGFVPPGMPEIDGESFAPLVTAPLPGDPDGGYAFSAMIKDRSVASGMRAIVHGKWKLIESSRGYELYDRRLDPGETHDLAKSNPDKLAEMRKLLDARRAIDDRSPFGS